MGFVIDGYVSGFGVDFSADFQRRAKNAQCITGNKIGKPKIDANSESKFKEKVWKLSAERCQTLISAVDGPEFGQF